MYHTNTNRFSCRSLNAFLLRALALSVHLSERKQDVPAPVHVPIEMRRKLSEMKIYFWAFFFFLLRKEAVFAPDPPTPWFEVSFAAIHTTF